MLENIEKHLVHFAVATLSPPPPPIHPHVYRMLGLSNEQLAPGLKGNIFICMLIIAM